MDWKTWTKISGIILFIIALVGFVGNYYVKGPSLELQNFPSVTDLDSLDVNEDITFTFFLYNTGDRTAFVDSIQINTELRKPITIEPKSDFGIEPGESQEVSVILSAANDNAEYTLQSEIFYGNKKIVSEEVPVLWGGLLE